MTGDIEQDTVIKDIKSEISSHSVEYRLYFVENLKLFDLYEAVRKNYKFELVVINQEKNYVSYNVIFTTLPILSINGEYSYKNEDGRDVMYGEFVLWNSMSEETTYNQKMSTGEYVEVIVNGQYQGLYLIQRRIDRKYLNLSDKDVLFKAGKTNLPENVTDAYEIEYSTLSEADTYALLNRIYFMKDCSQIVLNNFIDINLLMNFGVTLDNVGYVNVFYLFECLENNEYDISYIFGNTDMSFGLRWIDDFVYDVEYTKDLIINRQEYESMKVLYPELDQMMKERWVELRKTVLTDTKIWRKLEQYEEQIVNSGAMLRDKELWGIYTTNEDTIENLESFIKYRLQFLDRYYSRM